MHFFKTYGFEVILNPRSQCPYTGKEQVLLCKDQSIKCFFDAENGSYRFVLYQNGRSVSALQIMSKDGIFGTVANVITVKKHRRKGFAKRVWTEARKRFLDIQHSHILSEDGRIFATKCA